MGDVTVLFQNSTHGKGSQHDTLDILAFESNQVQFKDQLCTARSETENLRSTLDSANAQLHQLNKNLEEVRILDDSIERDINYSMRKKNLLENNFKAKSDSKRCNLEQELAAFENEKLKEFVRVLEMGNGEMVRQIEEVKNQCDVLSEYDLSKAKSKIDSIVQEKEAFTRRILGDYSSKISEITNNLELSKDTIKTAHYYADKLKIVKEEMILIEEQVEVTDSIAIVYKSILSRKNYTPTVLNENCEVFENMQKLGLHLDEQIANQYDIITALSTDLVDVRKKITDVLVMQETLEERCYDLCNSMDIVKDMLDQSTQTDCEIIDTEDQQIDINKRGLIKKELH